MDANPETKFNAERAEERGGAQRGKEMQPHHEGFGGWKIHLWRDWREAFHRNRFRERSNGDDVEVVPTG
jgi:hypothetical protein